MSQRNHAIGIMSGTSLDGVDIVFCEFEYDKKWSYKIIQGETVPYNEEWKKILGRIHKATAQEYAFRHVQYGHYLGELVNIFLSGDHMIPDFIASHGHTVFHQPGRGFTSQLGDGAALAAVSGFPVICDFRSADVALGGQGAPLVPIGDELLFPEYTYCLNLGGIANISFERDEERVAFDLGPCNMVLNRLAAEKGKEYDEDGELAAKGKVNEELLQSLNAVPFYLQPYPKSLGREDVDRSVWPMVQKAELKTEDKLATFCEHIAEQVGRVGDSGSLLVTGGGAFNSYLVSRIRKRSGMKVTVPDADLVNYKEALIFAFLGMLRWNGEVNCLASVTGAMRDSCGGAIYQP
jgi:anhydro-N-acetylmuramic acid kinase